MRVVAGMLVVLAGVGCVQDGKQLAPRRMPEECVLPPNEPRFDRPPPPRPPEDPTGLKLPGRLDLPSERGPLFPEVGP